eukprot:gene30157-35137_t
MATSSFTTSKDISRQAENSLIDDFNACAKGRSVSMTWACRKQYAASQDCLHIYVNDENIGAVKQRWFDLGKPRKPDWEAMFKGLSAQGQAGTGSAPPLLEPSQPPCLLEPSLPFTLSQAA